MSVTSPARSPRSKDPQNRRIRRTWWFLAGSFFAVGVLTAFRLVLGSSSSMDWVTAALVVLLGLAALRNRHAVIELEDGRWLEIESFARILRGLSRSVSPDAIVDAIVEELGGAAGADHTVVVRLRADSLTLEATLVSTRPGVPSSTTILPISDLEDRGNSRSADPDSVGIPIRPEPRSFPITDWRPVLGRHQGLSRRREFGRHEAVANLDADEFEEWNVPPEFLAEPAGTLDREAASAGHGAHAREGGAVRAAGASARSGGPTAGGSGRGEDIAAMTSRGGAPPTNLSPMESPVAVDPGPESMSRSGTADGRGFEASPMEGDRTSGAVASSASKVGARAASGGSIRGFYRAGTGRRPGPGWRGRSGGGGDAPTRIAEHLAERVRGIYGLKHTVAAPLRTPAGVVGAIVLSRRTADPWSPASLRILAGAAEEASLALARAYSLREAETRASTDALTGLPNRRYFDEFCGLLARRRRTDDAVGVLMIDIDHFKRVNDRYGHPVGDQVLRAVAGAISSAVRDDDVPARFGGEEFAVLLRNPSAAMAREVGERVRAAVAGLDLRALGPDRITVSVGVAVAREPDQPISELIDQADHALYRAKRMGRDRVMAA